MCISSDTCSFKKVTSWTVSSWGEVPLVDISLAQDLVTMGSCRGSSLAYLFLAIFWSWERGKWKKQGLFGKVETQHQNQVSLWPWHLTWSYHFQKKLALHPCLGIYHGEFLLWCKIDAQDWQVTETFMICPTKLAFTIGLEVAAPTLLTFWNIP